MAKISLRRLLSKLTVLALSASPAAASTDVALSSPSAFDDDADLDPRLTIDREHLDAHDAAAMLGRSLAHALAEMRPLGATHLAATWALAEDLVRRAAIANALEWAFPLVGDGIVIDHLSYDPDPAIRAATARAAWVRRATGGDHGVLARLAHDTDGEVRAIARGAR
ncbi:MAG: hypothetical protein JWO36_3069 [Myxococcales bacterium]|nr:hypothetical protein [Myxococcales bacterium]